jgi:hypothetical protein
MTDSGDFEKYFNAWFQLGSVYRRMVIPIEDLSFCFLFIFDGLSQRKDWTSFNT